MQCPLCSGPLTIVDPHRFVCERDHELSGPELERAAATRVTVAFWMAIEALQNEADALRAVGGVDQRSVDLAEQADKDAKVLRELALGRIRVGNDGSEPAVFG